MERSLDGGRARLQSVVEHGDAVLQHTNEAGTVRLRDETKQFREDLELLTNDVATTKSSLEQAVREAILFENSKDRLSVWLKETENSFNLQRQKEKDSIGKREYQEWLKVRKISPNFCWPI